MFRHNNSCKIKTVLLFNFKDIKSMCLVMAARGKKATRTVFRDFIQKWSTIYAQKESAGLFVMKTKATVLSLTGKSRMIF